MYIWVHISYLCYSTIIQANFHLSIYLAIYLSFENTYSQEQKAQEEKQ